MQPSMSWSAAGIEVDRICSANAAIVSRAIRNAKALIAFAEPRCPIPDDVSPGYYPTINFSWLEPFSITVEVFENRYEFYRFFDGRTEIRHIDIITGQSFPDALMRLLDGVLLDAGPSGASA